MGYVVPRPYKILVARYVAGESGLAPLRPATATVGTGRYDPIAGIVTEPLIDEQDIKQPAIQGINVIVTRTGHTVRAVVIVPPNGTPFDLTELGLYTSVGLCCYLESFRPVRLPAIGAAVEFDISLLPEI